MEGNSFLSLESRNIQLSSKWPNDLNDFVCAVHLSLYASVHSLALHSWVITTEREKRLRLISQKTSLKVGLWSTSLRDPGQMSTGQKTWSQTTRKAWDFSQPTIVFFLLYDFIKCIILCLDLNATRLLQLTFIWLSPYPAICPTFYYFLCLPMFCCPVISIGRVKSPSNFLGLVRTSGSVKPKVWANF